MNSFAEKLRSLISGSPSNHLENQNRPFDIIKTKAGILRELQISKDSGSLLGLFSPLSDGMLLVVVLDMETRGTEEIIDFQKYDVTGRVLSTIRTNLSDVKAICPFVKGRQRTLLTQ
jgi:hypothetical protein